MSFFDAHRARLEQAVDARRTRVYWSAFPRSRAARFTATAFLDEMRTNDARQAIRSGQSRSGFRLLAAKAPAWRLRHLSGRRSDTLIDTSMKAGEAWGRASMPTAIGGLNVERINKQVLDAAAMMHTYRPGTGRHVPRRSACAGPRRSDRLCL